MLGLIFQILVIIPLIWHICKDKFNNKLQKIVVWIIIISVSWFLNYILFYSKEKTDNLYDIMDISRYTSSSDARKIFRRASLKYHPDKNKSPEAYNIYLSLNDNMDIIKDSEKKEWYDYFTDKNYVKPQKPTAMSGDKTEYETTVLLQRLFASMYCVPFYLAWLFIPIAFLDKKRRKTKLAILLLIVLFAATELSFMMKKIPSPFTEIIEKIIPAKMTFREGFTALHVGIPYLIALVIAIFDIFVLKIYRESETDEEAIKRNIFEQIKLCIKIEKQQEKFITYLQLVGDYSHEIGNEIYNYNLNLYKKINLLTSAEEDIMKKESKWTIGKIISAGLFLMFLLGAVK